MREILLAFKNKCVTPQNRQSSQNIIGLNEKARIFVSSLNAFFLNDLILAPLVCILLAIEFTNKPRYLI